MGSYREGHEIIEKLRRIKMFLMIWKMCCTLKNRKAPKFKQSLMTSRRPKSS